MLLITSEDVSFQMHCFSGDAFAHMLTHTQSQWCNVTK